MFDPTICTMLQEFSQGQPPDHYWFGPWHAVLCTLFRGYAIAPQPRRNASSDFVIEVCQLLYPPGSDLRLRTVLIVKIKKNQDWEANIPSLEKEIGCLTDAAFSDKGTAISSVYWIGAMGTHWYYGVKHKGQDPKPLIDVHDNMHDQASYDDFQRLTALVAGM